MTIDIDANDITRGPWKALIVHEGYVEDDFSELDPEDEVDIVIVRGTALPDDEGKMPGTYKSGDVAFKAEDIYVDGEGDPTTAGPGVYARAQAMAAGLNGATEVEQLRAELDKVRAQLADTHNRAHTDATNLQQILRDKTALANERDAMREVVEAAKAWRDWYTASLVRMQSPSDAEEALIAAVDALTASEVAR